MFRMQVLVIVTLGVFGMLKLPVETALQDELRPREERQSRLTLSMREQLGQLASVAVLSGFRSMVAAFVYVDGHMAWERTEWGRLRRLLDLTVTLQPKAWSYWDSASWHMAWNASVAKSRDMTIPMEALRRKAQLEYFDLGVDFAQRGIRNNPTSWQLRLRLASIYRDKLDNPCLAAEQMLLGGKLPGAPGYMTRQGAYLLADCPGREEEAYKLLRDLYLEGERQRLPTLLKKLQSLESQLAIPASDRVISKPADKGPDATEGSASPDRGGNKGTQLTAPQSIP